MNSRIPLRSSAPFAVLFVLALASSWGAPSLAAQEAALKAPGEVASSPALWPETQRAFLQDGAGYLLTDPQRARLTALDDREARQRWIADFLTDSDPSTPVNELAEGIERRRELVAATFLSPRDVRAQVLFLRGEPAERYLIDCGIAFKPIEIWTYPEHELVFYRPAPGSPWRLWYPLESKRVLFTPEMEYLFSQAVQLGLPLRSKGVRRLTCDEGERLADATGIDGLRDSRIDRSQQAEIEAFLEPPADLVAWARTAAATEPPPAAGPLAFDELLFGFPERRNQRMLTRAYLRLPAAALEVDEAGGDPELRLTVDVVIEQDGRIFETARTRFRHRVTGAAQPLVFALDQSLRPEREYVARFRLEDEVGGGERIVSAGFSVPSQAAPVAQEALAVDVIQGLEVDLAHSRIAGADSLILAPAPEAVLAGLWRAEALVTGERIRKVTFSVDGKPQATRGSAPYSVEVRLAEVPRQQVVRAEGFDAAGELVATDEIVVNQPRGAFAVNILDPPRGFKGSGPVAVDAEIVIPDDERIEQVEIRLNEEPIAVLDGPPWRATVDVPEPAGGEDEVTYIAVAARLENGLSTEAVRFVNAPEYLQQLDIRLVELYAAVVDGSNRPVSGLAAEDFEVFEDGRRQEITKFELVRDLPLSIGVAIDTSGSMLRSLDEAQKTGRAFLDAVLRPGDRCFVLGFADQPELMMPPTDDAEACQRGLSDLRPYGATALHDAVSTSLYYFRGVRGQRALILLSDGDDTSSRTSFPATQEFARRNGVAIYAIGLEVSPIGIQVRAKLKDLAEETGGRVFFVRRAEELDDVYQEIEDELRNRYLIAYASDRQEEGSAQGAESFREVELKVRRRGLEARTSRGYYP